MPLLRPSSAGRFRPEALFRPQSVAVLGAGSPLGAEVVGNLLRGSYGGCVLPVSGAGRAVSGVLAYPDVGSLPLAPDLALFADAAPAGPELQALAARGTLAAVCLRAGPDEAARAAAPGMRVLGPHAFGLCVPGIGLNASTAHLQPRPGRIALVAQSGALCRAVLDWAEPNGVGFSHVVGLGVAASTGFAMVLDWLARDPGTGAILLDVRTVRDRRAFLSAARAAARLRPVVAIRAGGRLSDPTGFGDQVFDAALRRAGVVRVARLSDLFAAAETLTRAKPAASERLAIVTNAVGPGQMAADAALGAGLQLAEAPEADTAPPGPARSGAASDSDPRQGRFADGILWTGGASPTRLADAAADAAALPGIGGVLAILSPQRDAAAGAAGLAGLPAKIRVPLLACALGETTGAAQRRTLAEAGVPSFATPESAVRGFEHLVWNRRARAAARELPSGAVLELHPDRERVAGLLTRAQRTGDGGPITDGIVAELLAAYGFGYAGDVVVPLAAQVHVRVLDDTLFGPAIGIAADRRSRAQDSAWDLPPLNLPLASALVVRADAVGALDRLSSGERHGLADALVQLSQLVVDTPSLASLAADLRPGNHRWIASGALLTLHPPGGAARLAIAPYPAELTERFQAGSEALVIRPIRPEDAEAHAALFKRLTPEDVRYRFFSALRDLPPEQVVRMTQVDYDREIAFVAVRNHPGPFQGQTVGVARLVREGYAEEEAWGEFAVVVQSDMKGKGVGRRLMQRIEEWGRAHGLAGIEGQILAENAPMLAFIRRLGYEVRRMPEEPEVMEARRAL